MEWLETRTNKWFHHSNNFDIVVIHHALYQRLPQMFLSRFPCQTCIWFNLSHNESLDIRFTFPVLLLRLDMFIKKRRSHIWLPFYNVPKFSIFIYEEPTPFSFCFLRNMGVKMFYKLYLWNICSANLMVVIYIVLLWLRLTHSDGDIMACKSRTLITSSTLIWQLVLWGASVGRH